MGLDNGAVIKANGIRVARVAGGILVPVLLTRAEVICGKPLHIKPLRCVCGRLTDATGGPVSDVTVAVLRDGVEVAHLTTGPDGKFTFGELDSGTYDLNATAYGFRTLRTSIRVAKPDTRCRRRLEIYLDTGGLESCGSRVTKQ